MSDNNVVSEIVGQPSNEAAPSEPVETSAQPVEQPTNEAPESEVQAPVNDSDNMSARFAALARKEKALREQEERIKEEANKYSKYAELESTAKENPLSILERYGLDLDTIIAASLGEDAPAPSVEDQIKALRDEINSEKEAAKAAEEKRKQEEEEAYQASIEEAILTHKNSIADHLGQNQEKYELIHLQNAQDLVWEVTEAHFEAHNGEVLTPEQAADKVEAYLEDQVKKALELERFKQKEAAKAEFKIEESVPAPRQERPTLTSSMTDIAPEKIATNGMTEEESKRRAAELLKWK